MYVMTESQWRSFIGAATRTGKLATVGADGTPHVVPIWFIEDNGTYVFSSGATTKKTRNIEANPKISLCVDDENFPYSFVTMHAEATIERLPVPELRHYTTRIAERYVPAGRAMRYGDRNAADTEVLIRLAPRKVIAWANMSEETATTPTQLERVVNMEEMA